MEVDRRPNLGNDKMKPNGCHSFGSNYHPSSQSRKMSVGITVDSSTQKKSETGKEAGVDISNETGKVLENYSEPKSNGKGTANTANKGKQTDGIEQVSSPWITKRSSHQKEPTLRNGQSIKQRRPAADGKLKKLNGVSEKQTVHDVQFFTTVNTTLQTSDDSQKKFSDITYTRRKGKDAAPDCVDNFTYATAQDDTSSGKDATPDKLDKPDKGKSETLRMKLWEILGNISSPKSQNSNPKFPDIKDDRLKVKEDVNRTAAAVVKPIHFSDTIETDSEGPNQTTVGPLTRALAKKRASHREQQKKTKIGLCSAYKKTGEKKNVYSFQEGCSGEPNGDINFDSSIPKRKKNGQTGSTIIPRKICFSDKDNGDGPQRASYNRQSSPWPEKTSLPDKKTEGFHGCSLEDKLEQCKPKLDAQKEACQLPNLKTVNQTGHQKASYSRESALWPENTSLPGQKLESFHGFPLEDRMNKRKLRNDVKEKDCQLPNPKTLNQTGDFDNPLSVENMNHQEHCNRPFANDAQYPLDEFQSPTPAFKIPSLNPSFCSSPESVQIEQTSTAGPDETRFTVGNFCSFRSWNTPKSASEADSEPPDGADKPKEDSPCTEPSPVNRKTDADNGLLESPFEDGDPSSSDEDSPIRKKYNYQRQTSPENGSCKELKDVDYPVNWLQRNGVKVAGFSYPLGSPKGTLESDEEQEQRVQILDDDLLQEPTEQNQEDDLTRVVTLFAIALDNFRKKMNSVTKKKSSEILISVSEDVHLQLKNVESQIQKDVVQLASLSKSKRKRWETLFEEQQQQLALIHEQFKKDIHRHFQGCCSILEMMEANQIELKGRVKKQRSSHQKLFLQFEEAVETQLNDAQRKITTVHESAREKMQLLKRVIAECLN